jgi:hypothetical protein
MVYGRRSAPLSSRRSESKRVSRSDSPFSHALSHCRDVLADSGADMGVYVLEYQVETLRREHRSGIALTILLHTVDDGVKMGGLLLRRETLKFIDTLTDSGADDRQAARLAVVRALPRAGSRIPRSKKSIAITTSSSTSVNPGLVYDNSAIFTVLRAIVRLLSYSSEQL